MDISFVTYAELSGMAMIMSVGDKVEIESNLGHKIMRIIVGVLMMEVASLMCANC